MLQRLGGLMEKPVLKRKPHREFCRIAEGFAQSGGAAWVAVPGFVGRIDETATVITTRSMA